MSLSKTNIDHRVLTKTTDPMPCNDVYNKRKRPFHFSFIHINVYKYKWWSFNINDNDTVQ